MERVRSLEQPKHSDFARAELEALRKRAEELEAHLRSQEASSQEAVQHVVHREWLRSAGTPSPGMEPRVEQHPEAITLKLAPEKHDEQMGELLWVLQNHGVSKAIAAAERTGNPHLIDDFHRILVEWVREGLPAKKTPARYDVPLHLSVFEITLAPKDKEENKPQDQTKALHEYISLMEQLLRSMQQMDAKHGEFFSFEIAKPSGSNHTRRFAAVPHTREAMFQKSVQSLYPHAKVNKTNDDYNIFADNAHNAAATAMLGERSIYPLRTYDTFSSDPLDVLLNAFSKLDTEQEGAAVQWVISPRDKGLLERYRKALTKVHAGASLSSATDVRHGFWGFVDDVIEFFSQEKKTSSATDRVRSDDPRLKNIERKISSPIMLVDIRLVASAATQARAREVLQDLQTPFQQLADTSGNRLLFKELSGRRLKAFAQEFSYRLLDEHHALPLSVTEIATLIHLPNQESAIAAPELKHETRASAPAPTESVGEGVVLGVNTFRGVSKEVRLASEDRLRHLYVIGQTGTGKSTLLKNIILQDIQSGAGVCMIDPHGSDVLDVLAAIPPERVQDVIYFDPGETARPMGLNMMEYDRARPEQKTLVVDELLGIFKKLFGAVPESMGPAFEQYFRNAALLVMESPELGNTLLDISRVFSDEAFRQKKLAACKNPVVLQFWQNIALKTTGEQGLENYAPYITNKFDVFTTNEIVRPIIAQQRSAFNFRDLMDSRKILLVNLAKGRIGELNANLLGLVIVGKFLIAALSRADAMGKSLPPFYLHIDEFQNFTTPSIATIFSEARKYKLSLTVAHQFIAQLTDEIRDAVFGNVGSMCAFRVGPTDAEMLEKQFAPTFSKQDLINVENRNAYVRMLVQGRPAPAFNIETLPYPEVNTAHINDIKQLSYLQYGRPRAEVEAEILSGLTYQQPQS